ncbi:MAG: YebC/PmpR family DNA-binding transcriptional regulator [bacterium]
MSGHSKWATIHKQKSVLDAKRGAVFTKLARNITLAAREKGGDPEMNPSLRAAIDKAKELNMPKDNIERAIKKGTGELEGARLEEIIYEGFGPAGAALIIKCLTDNKNRTASNIRHILTKYGGRMGEPNSVAWMFSEFGVIRIDAEELGAHKLDRDEFELALIDKGAEDFKTEDGEIIILSDVKNLSGVKEAVEKIGIKIDSSEVEQVAKNEVEVKGDEKEKIEKLLEALDDDEDVQIVYVNVKI